MYISSARSTNQEVDLSNTSQNGQKEDKQGKLIAASVNDI
jgi:hypothetical protein